VQSGQQGTSNKGKRISLGLRLSATRNATESRRRIKAQGSGDIHVFYGIKTTLACLVSRDKLLVATEQGGKCLLA
jgi:hypothetical protein